MKLQPKYVRVPIRPIRQRGVVLFFALIALLAMSLAAVALIRSVDTATLIAGNLSFKRAATTSGDAGVEAALNWLASVQGGYPGNMLQDTAHPFNNTGGAGTFTNPGYYSSVAPNVSLTDGTGIQWTDADSKLVGTDAAGNTIRYVIQRLCRDANVLPGTTSALLQTPPRTDCLYSGAIVDNNNQAIQLPQDVCNGPSCPTKGQNPMLRITSRTTGPKFTVSYVQAFVY